MSGLTFLPPDWPGTHPD